jgi:hypothetical protein
MSGFLRIAVVLVAAAAAALVANFALLGVATSGDPVGRLSPRAGPALPLTTATKASHPVPRWEHERHADD